MKTTVTKHDFIRAFKELRPNAFSDTGLSALFNYLEELEKDSTQELELDVIALCCEFTEFENLEEFQSEYGDEYEDIGEIEDKTIVIKIDDDSFIIKDF